MKRRVLKVVLSIVLVVLLSVAAVSVFRYLNRPGRLKDKEFHSGSQIQLTRVDELQTENLCRLAKVWGFVKYRHPLVVSGQVNWDAELFRVMPGVLDAGSREEANAVVVAWLERFPYEAPAKLQKDNPDFRALYRDAKPILEADLSWLHDESALGAPLSGYLVGLAQADMPDTAQGYAAFSKGNPQVSLDAEEPYPDMKYDDTGMRLLGLFRYWNAIEYFFPYKDIMGENWDLVLKDMLPQFVDGQDALSYVLSLSRLSTHIHDTHAVVYDPQTMLHGFLGRNTPPVEFLSVDGKIVISAVDIDRSKGAESLLPGDIVLAVDGIPIEERIDLCREYVSLSDRDRFTYTLQPYLLGTNKDSLSIKVLREGRPLTLTAACFPDRKALSGEEPSRLMVEENIGYLNPGTFDQNTVDVMMKAFEGTKGLIVDLRNYPNRDSRIITAQAVADYINPESTQFSRLGLPNPLLPGSFMDSPNFNSVYCRSGQGAPLSYGERPHYTGKVVILMDDGSISQCEFTAMSLRAAPNAVVLGSASTGADGDVVRLKLPGGAFAAFTGLSVFYPDGTRTQRVGLQPDILVTPTVEGLRAGRDELVEHAAALILAN